MITVLTPHTHTHTYLRDVDRLVSDTAAALTRVYRVSHPNGKHIETNDSGVLFERDSEIQSSLSQIRSSFRLNSPSYQNRFHRHPVPYREYTVLNNIYIMDANMIQSWSNVLDFEVVFGFRHTRFTKNLLPRWIEDDHVEFRFTGHGHKSTT